MSGSVPESDLKSKYGRLAAEYSKLRTHLTVLKRAVVEEQAKSGELRESLRARDAELRRRDLEIDSLNFRNQQLAKRVTVLQVDLDAVQSRKTKKSKSKNETPEHSLAFHDESVIQEELQKKIVENARLVSQMADREFELSQLRSQVSDAEKQLNEADSKHKCDILKLRIQNQELVNAVESASSCKGKSSLPMVGSGGPDGSSSDINGDYVSDVGSLIGSEDALSVEESHLNERLKRKTELLSESEKENQQMKIEMDLLKIDIRILNSKLRAASEQEKNASVSTLSDSEFKRDFISTIIGQIESPLVITDEIFSREERLQTYFRNLISSLVAEKQKNESISKYHIDENNSLRAHLDHLKKEKSSLESGIANTQSTISKLEDELHSTTTNYEQQVTLLTEHVGNLNDKLARQAEEIQRMKGNL